MCVHGGPGGRYLPSEHVAMLPTPGFWGIPGFLQTLRFVSVLYAGEEKIVTTCDMRSVLNLRCRVLCGMGDSSMDHYEHHLKPCRAPTPPLKRVPLLFDRFASLS